MTTFWHPGSTFEGTRGGDWYTDHNSDSDMFRDVVFGNGGTDYLRTGGGNDKITLANNHGDWDGDWDVFGNAAIADGGDGNDQINVNANRGAFQITTGEGQDRVTVKGGDYVQVQAADGDWAHDTFRFKTSFHGTAELYGVDHSDVLDLRGGHWHEQDMNGDLGFYNDMATYDAWGNEHHATIQVMGVSADYADAHPTILL